MNPSRPIRQTESQPGALGNEVHLELLVVDDDEPLRCRLARAFADRGYRVRSAASAREALGRAKETVPGLAIVDLKMPGESGLTLVGQLHQLNPAMRILVLTGYGSISTATEAMRLGACNYLQKPADADQVLAAFRQSTPPENVPVAVAHEQVPLQTPSLARVEWEHIHRVLSDCDGNISEAARRLAIHRRSLQRKLQKHPPQT